MYKIGGISDIMIEIQDLLVKTSMTVDEIADMLNVPVDWVESAEIMLHEDYDHTNYDDGMDGDHASALASAGFGMDEDYAIENDYFDDMSY